MVQAKIFATIGPTSNKASVLRKMTEHVLDGVRLNFSHGSQESHIRTIQLVRALNKKRRRAVKIMQDLEGYRIRVGYFAQPKQLHKNAILYLTQDKTKDRQAVSFDYVGSLRGIRPGVEVYIDDGKIVLRVLRIEKRRLKTRVVTGGELYGHKGINIVGADLEFDALTAKDKKDVQVAIAYKLDYVAQSFVRSAEDIVQLRRVLQSKHASCQIFAKVENRQALDHLDEIVDEADGVIVARGDLGVCLPIYEVPVLQKEIIKRCRLKNKPVMVATQMLDSMTHELRPTRAEVSDVANAILDGASHMLLSQETAIGNYPDRVIAMMNKVAEHTENYQKTLRSLLR